MEARINDCYALLSHNYTRQYFCFHHWFIMSMFHNILKYFHSRSKQTVVTQKEIGKIIVGYIRRLENQYRFTLPNDLTKIVMDYYPKWTNYTGKFLAENGGKHIQIQPNQLSFTGSKCIKLDQRLPTSLKSSSITNAFRWRAVAGPEVKGCVLFGVISNRCDKYYLHSSQQVFLVDIYAISTVDSLIYEGGWYTNDPTINHHYKAFRRNEIICMKYEISQGDQCTLSFYNESQNNEFLWTINLPKYISQRRVKNWYPVFTKTSNSGFIRVIPY